MTKNITSNLSKIQSTLPTNVKLIAISKFHSKDAIIEAYNAGQRRFGESRMQELVAKKTQLPNDIEWHFIGHLQTNKVKAITSDVDTIHSLDSLKLFKEIDKQASLANKNVKCLLEIRIAQEDTKDGFSIEDCKLMLETGDWKESKSVRIVGVMGMASNTNDLKQVRAEFRKLKCFFDELKEKYFFDDEDFNEISMGMSHDYMIAIEEGATMVRIGSSIFGEREY